MPAVQIPSGRLVKVATGDQKTFESSLASIGRSFLGSQAPNLFDHEIGFQVVDSDEDNTRAVGVFGFRVGSRLLYVPLFYRDGVVKGTEQLRDPKRKLCVPLTDNWVNYFLSQEDDHFGELIPRWKNRDTAQPSLWQLKYPPTKYAADNADWVKEAVVDLARAFARAREQLTGGFRPSADLDLVKEAEAHPELFDTLGSWATRYHWFGEALERFHGRAKVAAALGAVNPVPPPPDPMAGTVFARSPAARPVKVAPKAGTGGVLPAAAEPVKAEATKAGAVTVIRYREVSVHRVPLHPKVDFASKELDDLQGGRNAYRDSRDDGQVSDAELWLGGANPEQVTYANPSESGIYEVIVHTGKGPKLEECAVFTALLGFGPRVGRCLVVRLSDKAWRCVHNNAVWVKGQKDRPAFWKWVAELPKVNGELPEGDVVSAVSVEGAATAPFRLYRDGKASPDVWGVHSSQPYWAAFDPWERRPVLHEGSREDHTGIRVIPLDTPGKRIVRHGKDLYLTRDTRLLKLGDESLELAGGTEPDFTAVGWLKASAEGRQLLSVRKVGSGFEVDDPRTKKAVACRDGNDAEECLVVSHGLRVGAARELVKAAALTGGASAFVKYAERLSTNWPNAPPVDFDMLPNPAGFADDVLPATTASHQAIPINDLLMQPGSPDRYKPYPVTYGTKGPMPGIGNGGTPDRAGSQYGRDGGPDPPDFDTVARAARTGRRELFDTAGLASLVKHTRIRGLLDRVAPRMLRTVSDLGDVCAHMYWNVDEWAEQFGQSEVGPLEDQLKGLFEGLGEAYLTLKEKTVELAPDAGVVPDTPQSDAADASN